MIRNDSSTPATAASAQHAGEFLLALLAPLGAPREEVDPCHQSKLLRARPQAIISAGASCARACACTRGPSVICASGLAITRRHAELLFDHLGDARDGGAATGQHDLVDAVELAAGVEELQQAADLLDHGFLERLEHLDLVAFRQAALALGQAGFLVAQAVAAHDLVGQLLAAEHLLAGVDAAAVAQHVERGHGRADVDQRHQAVARHVERGRPAARRRSRSRRPRRP